MCIDPSIDRLWSIARSSRDRSGSNDDDENRCCVFHVWSSLVNGSAADSKNTSLWDSCGRRYRPKAHTSIFLTCVIPRHTSINRIHAWKWVAREWFSRFARVCMILTIASGLENNIWYDLPPSSIESNSVIKLASSNAIHDSKTVLDTPPWISTTLIVIVHALDFKRLATKIAQRNSIQAWKWLHGWCTYATRTRRNARGPCLCTNKDHISHAASW